MGLYPSTNNYANKNQWPNNRRSLAHQLKPGTFPKAPVGHTGAFGKVPWTTIKMMTCLSAGKWWVVPYCQAYINPDPNIMITSKKRRACSKASQHKNMHDCPAAGKMGGRTLCRQAILSCF